MSWEEAIEHVVSDVDFAIRVPTSEGRVLTVKDSFGEGEPLYLFGLLFPKLLSEFWRSCSSKGFLVCVLSHQIKFIMAVSSLHKK